MKSFLSYFFVVSLMTPVAFAQVPYYYLMAQSSGPMGPPGGGGMGGPGMMMGGPGMGGVPMQYELSQLKSIKKKADKAGYSVLSEIAANGIEMIEGMQEMMGGGEDEEGVMLEPDVDDMKGQLASLQADKTKLASEKSGLSSLPKKERTKKGALINTLAKLIDRGAKQLTMGISEMERHLAFDKEREDEEGKMQEERFAMEKQGREMGRKMMDQGRDMAKQRMEQEMARGEEMRKQMTAQGGQGGQGGGPGGPGRGFMGDGQFTGGMGPMMGGGQMGGPNGMPPWMQQGGDHGPQGGGPGGFGFPGPGGQFPGGGPGQEGFQFPGQGFGPGGPQGQFGGQFPGMGMPMPGGMGMPPGFGGPQGGGPGPSGMEGAPAHAPEASGGTQGSIYRIYRDYLRARWQ